jgi:hypothetical protein
MLNLPLSVFRRPPNVQTPPPQPQAPGGPVGTRGHWSERPKSMWVFPYKLREDQSAERFKARLVAKGFTQRCDIEYAEVWVPTGKIGTPTGKTWHDGRAVPGDASRRQCPMSSAPERPRGGLNSQQMRLRSGLILPRPGCFRPW